MLLNLTSAVCGEDVYPEDSFIESIYPRTVQEFINVTVESKCTNTELISGFFEEAIIEKNNTKTYTTEIVLYDYDGNG